MKDLGIDILFVRGIIPEHISGLIIQAGIEGHIKLLNDVYLQSLYIEVQITPPTFWLVGTVQVRLQSSFVCEIL